MSEYAEETQQQSGLNLNEVLYILFRHKWKILLCTVVGLAAAAAVYLVLAAPYESQAKLLVRYVVERSPIDKLDAPAATPDPRNNSLVNSEVEILTSSDLAMQAVEAIGVERLFPGAKVPVTKAEAARSILNGLKVAALPGSSIISISYQNPDRQLAAQVLEQLVNRYFDKHLEVHRSVGAFDFVTRETEQVRAQLSQTEEELKQLKAKAGVTSLVDNMAMLNTELVKAREELDGSEADLAAQQARVKELEKLAGKTGRKRSEEAVQPPSTKVVQEYKDLVEQLNSLRQTELELLSRYTPENRLVKVRRAQIEKLEQQRRDLDMAHPGLFAMVPAGQEQRPDLMAEQARLVAIEARTAALRSRLNSVQERTKALAEYAPQIAKLERRRELEETNYKYFTGSLEKARVDETLDPSRIPNISYVQRPSVAEKATRDIKKIVLGLACGGLGLGIGIALLIDLVLDRTVKRSLDLETRLGIPLLVSIPYFSRRARSRRSLPKGHSARALPKGAQASLAPWEDDHFIRRSCEEIRDRLILFFELQRMSHKPKLVAVTGVSKGAGGSTLAAGLAAALSETGEGKVLFVDMNARKGWGHPFFEGRPAASLAEALGNRSVTSAAEQNLYLATATSPNDKARRFIPRRFYDLVPQFKASDFDYVIFDMPALSETSAPLAAASFMDKVLLVVEAEKSSRKAVKRAYNELASTEANVSTVLNKSRSYGPKWLDE
jgi:polysaccharide biosynthesis transport protein